MEKRQQKFKEMKGNLQALAGHRSEDIFRFLTPYGTVLDIGCGGKAFNVLKREGVASCRN